MHHYTALLIIVYYYTAVRPIMILIGQNTNGVVFKSGIASHILWQFPKKTVVCRLQSLKDHVCASRQIDKWR